MMKETWIERGMGTFKILGFGLVCFFTSLTYGDPPPPRDTTDNSPQPAAQEPYSSSEPDMGGSGLVADFLKSEASKIDYTSIAKAMRAGCKAAQIDDSVPFPTAVVDLDVFFIIQGRAGWLPPYPSNPNSTIHGVDSDGDCVRDDIEHYIAKMYRGRGQSKLRKYLYEYTAWMDRSLVSGLSVNAAKTSFNNMAAAGECIEREVSDGTATDIVDDLFAKFHNTFPRIERYLYNSRQTSGWTTRDEISISCP